MFKSLTFLLILSLVLLSCSENEEKQFSNNKHLLQKEIFVDSVTYIPITRYFIDSTNVHAGYVTNSFYINDNDFFFFSDHDRGLILYRHSVDGDTKISNAIDKDAYNDTNFFGLTPVIASKRLFYAVDNTIYSYDIEFKIIHLIGKLAESEILWAPLHATRDGNWLSTTISIGEDTYITRIDVKSGKINYLASPFLGTEQAIANHSQIHPFDPKVIMFAHEGSWVRDRIWIWNLKNDRSNPLYIQPEYVEIGHEFWMPDGLGIYAVQYGSPARGIPSGINVYDLTGSLIEEIRTTDYYLSHAAISPDGKYFIADTYRPDGNSDYWIVLIDRNSHRFTKVAKISFSSHPAHPHPNFSPSGNKIMFNNLNLSSGKIELNEVNLFDILGK